MTPKEFYAQIATITEVERITLSPGPLVMVASWQDALSGKLMLWLLDQMPPEATEGDTEDVLINALWWTRFWAQTHYAAKQDIAAAEATLLAAVAGAEQGVCE